MARHVPIQLPENAEMKMSSGTSQSAAREAILTVRNTTSRTDFKAFGRQLSAFC